MESLHRFLELVRKELEADDARLEFGGKPPTDPRAVWHELPGDLRLVALLPAPTPADTDRLAALARSFSGVLEEVGGALPSPQAVPGRGSADLDLALAVLASAAGACCAVVIDEHCPILWGTSDTPRGDEDLDELVRAAEGLTIADRLGLGPAAIVELGSPAAEAAIEGLDAADRSRLQWAAVWWTNRRTLGRAQDLARRMLGVRGIAGLRRRELAGPGTSYLIRPVAGIYRLALIFDAPYSQLQAEGAVLRALPAIERLIESLPPRTPEPRRGAQVLTLPRRS